MDPIRCTDERCFHVGYTNSSSLIRELPMQDFLTHQPLLWKNLDIAASLANGVTPSTVIAGDRGSQLAYAAMMRGMAAGNMVTLKGSEDVNQVKTVFSWYLACMSSAALSETNHATLLLKPRAVTSNEGTHPCRNSSCPHLDQDQAFEKMGLLEFLLHQPVLYSNPAAATATFNRADASGLYEPAPYNFPFLSRWNKAMAAGEIANVSNSTDVQHARAAVEAYLSYMSNASQADINFLEVDHDTLSMDVKTGHDEEDLDRVI